MSFKDVAGSHLLWVCVIVGIIIVAGLTVYYLRLSYKNALELGIDKKTLKDVTAKNCESVETLKGVMA